MSTNPHITRTASKDAEHQLFQAASALRRVAQSGAKPKSEEGKAATAALLQAAIAWRQSAIDNVTQQGVGSSRSQAAVRQASPDGRQEVPTETPHLQLPHTVLGQQIRLGQAGQPARGRRRHQVGAYRHHRDQEDQTHQT